MLVAVRAAGINSADLVPRMGFYPAPPGWPQDIPGMELAGEVLSCGPGAERFASGDRVMAVVGGGAQAELALVEEAETMAVPEGTSWPEAGGFPEAVETAFDALFVQCGLQLGERVRVTGAAGGVGTAAVQLAALAGAEVVASVRNKDLHDDVAALGAQHVAVPDEVPALGPFDVVLELVAGPALAETVGALAIGGRVAVIGVGGGAAVELNLFALMQHRARIAGSTLRARPPADKAHLARIVEARTVPALAQERLRIPIADTFALADAGPAYERFGAGGKLGKIVLVND